MLSGRFFRYYQCQRFSRHAATPSIALDVQTNNVVYNFARVNPVCEKACMIYG